MRGIGSSLSGLGLCLLMCGGCPLLGPEPEGGTGPERCEQDRYACESRADVPPVDGCMLSGVLAVELGQGEAAFEPLADDEVPPIFEGGGGFQGPGVAHLLLGLRIEDAALDQYDVLGAHLALYDESACAEQPDGGRVCQGIPYLGERWVLLGDGPQLNVVGDAVEEFALTVVTDAFAEGDYVIEATVTDPCGQVGIAHHAFSY